MIVENMAGSHLVEMYGQDPELMGSIGKAIGRAVRKTGRVVSRTVKNPGRALAYAAAPVTGGASLLATKAGRDAVGKTARFTQKKILRPATHGVLTAARNPVVQQAAGTALRAGAAYATGGASEAALRLRNNIPSFAPRKLPSVGKVSSLAARVATDTTKRSSGIDWVDRLRRAGRAAVDQVIPPDAPSAETAKAGGLPMPLLIGGAAALGLVAFLAMNKGK